MLCYFIIALYLRHDVVPIVMGGRKSGYLLAAGHHSYVHVEQLPSARDLANCLQRLDQSVDLYNEFFAWKGTGEFIDTKFWCRLCALLHDDASASGGATKGRVVEGDGTEL